MSIKTIIRATAILLVLLCNAAWAQSLKEGLDAINEGDYETAFKIFQSQAERGNAFAQHNLATMYRNRRVGNGARNDSEAVRWYRAAAEQGLARAQNVLAMYYDNGVGVPQDYSEAARLYQAAATQGLSAAQYNLGNMYYRGEGVPQDYTTAHMWFNIASANNFEYGTENRERIAELMSHEAIEEAQTRARICMESNYQDCD
jgi:hypothetical protein